MYVKAFEEEDLEIGLKFIKKQLGIFRDVFRIDEFSLFPL